MDKQSVRIGVDMLFYAKITADTISSLTYGTPVALKGVTEVVVTRNKSKLTHYSDNGPTEVIGQDGEQTVAFKHDGLTAAVKADMLGTDYSASTGLYRDGMGEQAPYIAIGYRSKKGNGKYRYTWFLKGQVSEGNETNQTVAGSVTVQSDDFVFSAIKPVYYGSVAYGIKNSLDSDDANIPSGLTDALLAVPETGFFSAPLYTPVAPGTAIADLAGVSGASAGYIALSFTAPAGCTSAYAQVKDPISSTWQTATTVAAIVAASTSAVITGLTPGNTYDVRLVVIGGTKNGFSNTDEDVVALAA